MAHDLLLLDTHVWIWLMRGDAQLHRSTCLARIDEAMTRSAIRISAISVWETGMLESKGRLHFPVDCVSWVRAALAAPGVSLVEMSPEIAIASSRLPGNFHGDPADRLLVATARALNATLVTRDKQILAYADQKWVKAVVA